MRNWTAAAVLLLPLVTAAAQQPSADDQARMLLDSARRAHAEKNFPFAAARFREFLEKFGSHKDAAAARYGLALTLLDSPERDYKTAAEQLQQIAGVNDFPDRPFVLYYLGYAQRGQGLAALAQAAAKPPEAKQHQDRARQHFEQAAPQFAAAVPLFAAKAGNVPPTGELPPLLEWSARARCDHAEMLLRLGKPKEAQAAVTPLLDDANLKRSRNRPMALYTTGHAAYLLGDHAAAARSLAQLAPFADPVFGTHARYLLGRVHHLAGERPEAAAHYEAVIRTFDEAKKAAQPALANPALKDNPDEKLRLEALLKGPAPEYVGRASFYLGVLLYEEGKYADAQARFATFAQQFPGSALLPEVQLRLGMSLVQLKRANEALPVLQPLEAQLPAYADQVIRWIGRAQQAQADPNNAATVEQHARQAADTFRRAADRANQLAAQDPDAKVRRSDLLLELADAQMTAKQFKEAAATFQQVAQENAHPDRVEEAMQRQATALHLAGQYKESDDACQRFLDKYPKSTLLPAVLFRRAENAYFAASAAAAQPNLPDRDKALKQLFGEAAQRYQAAVAKAGDFPHVNVARLGLAQCYYRLGDYEKALAALGGIGSGDRAGDLAMASYLEGDCLLRTMPADANDALTAARAQEQLGNAIKLLDGYVGAAGNGPQVPDALVKLGFAHQQLAVMMAEPAEKTKELTAARQAYEKVMQQFGNHPLAGNAILERAQCLVLAGDVNGGLNELNRFTTDPLRNSPVAPVALVRLAGLMRGQRRAADAAKLLEQHRPHQEGRVMNDPNQKELAALLRCQHGLALRDLGKPTEARAIFETVVRDFANRPEAVEGAWRVGQCRKDEAVAKLDAAAKLTKPEERKAATDEGLKLLRETAQYFETQAQQAQAKAAGSEGHLRMLYEAAWCYRDLFARDAKANAGSDAKARQLYQAVIAAAPDSPAALDARLETADLLAEKGEYDAAVKLLSEALEKDPAPEVAEQMRLRLGAIHLGRGDAAAGFAALDALVQGAKGPLAAEARWRAAECLLHQPAGANNANWAKAITYLTPFKDQPPLQNVAGVSDRALLRLGHAHALLGQWDASRQVLELLLQRYPQSVWANEARYGIGWAWQNQKQHENAVNTYKQVTAATTTEVAARAQLQLGLCRLEQKRPAEAATALLVVPYTYDYPELSALALCEASRALVEMKQPDQAANLLKKVVKDHPQSRWAKVAEQRLAEIR